MNPQKKMGGILFGALATAVSSFFAASPPAAAEESCCAEVTHACCTPDNQWLASYCWDLGGGQCTGMCTSEAQCRS